MMEFLFIGVGLEILSDFESTCLGKLSTDFATIEQHGSGMVLAATLLGLTKLFL